MSIGFSLFLIALGAILRFGVAAQHAHGFNVGVIGVILMIIGAVGLLISIVWLSMRRRTDVIHHARGTTVIEPNDEPIDRY